MAVADFIKKIDPILIQENPILQANIMHNVREFRYAPVEWTNRLLEHAVNSEENRMKIITSIDSMPLNDESVKHLLKLADIVDITQKHLIVRTVNNLKPEYIVKYGKEFVRKKLVTKEYVDYCQFLLDATEKQLWNQYNTFLNELEKADQFDSFLFRLTKQLATILVEKGYYKSSIVRKIIEEDLKEDWFTFEGIMSIYVAGLLQDESLIPQLASLLASNDDFVVEEILETLQRFQCEEAVHAVLPYAKNKDHYIFSLGVLKEIKNEAAENALVQCYDYLDADGKIMCIEGLVGHLSPKAFPLIEDYVEKGHENTVLEAEELFYFFYKIMGESHPLLEKWEETTVAREQQYSKMIKRDNMLIKENIEKQAPPQKKVKVGRNDPCPCGSGKKYKKCCGK